MGTKDATRADLHDFLDGWPKKPDLKHRGCSGGSIVYKDSVSFECNRCNLYWNKSRIEKWTDLEIIERFYVETPVADQLHKLVTIKGVTYCVPVDKDAENEPEGS